MYRNFGLLPKYIHTTTRSVLGKGCYQPSRGFCWGNRCLKSDNERHLPIFRRRFDDIFRDDSWALPARMINHQMKAMERMMEDVFPSRPRWWSRTPWEEYPVDRKGDKELNVKYDRKLFEVKLDVSDYKPEDLNVKVAGDTLTVSGKYSEKHDEHGSLSREFTRQFAIPEDVEVDSFESMLEGGKLIVRAKVKGSENVQEKTINIKREEPKK